MARILIVEDEENLRLTIRRALSRAGSVVSEAANLREARALITSSDFDLVLTDLVLGTENGLDFVRELRGTLSEWFDGVVVVMTAYSSVENAVAAMRHGADDYLQKPLSLEELGLQVEKWMEHRRLVQRVRLYERLEKAQEQSREIVGQSTAWQQTLALANKLASVPLDDYASSGHTPPFGIPAIGSPAHQGESGFGPGGMTGGASLPSILLTGETGVGKGVLARYIHAKAEDLAASSAARRGGSPARSPFVHLNCSALPASLVEDEIFGHEKGAFTDAREARPGLFEMADGGTVFLDEIGEMPLELQAKLLLVVESGRFRRVGGTKERRVRARVIAASNQNLEDRVRAGAFRRDLLYRLNTFTVRIPPLREREGDALLIAAAAVDRLCRRYGRPSLELSAGARRAIAEHPWPGNVRELLNAVQRAVMLCDGDTIDAADLGIQPAEHLGAEAPVSARVGGEARGEALGCGELGWAAKGQPPGQASAERLPPTAAEGLKFDFVSGIHRFDEVERELMIQALRHTRGNVSRASKLIGMQRSSFRYRLERYGLNNHTKDSVAEIGA